MTGTSASRPSARIPTLDGLRAVAILLVITSHTVITWDMPGVVRLGYVGVLIFFALSGYLITNRLLEEFRFKGSISLRNFYLRRFFRILPPATFYLMVVFILSQIGIVDCSTAAIRAALLFYTSYVDYGDAGWRVGHFWSLSVEEHFYLIWPCLLIGFGASKGWRQAAIGAVTICVWRVFDDHYHIVSGFFNAPYLDASPFRTDLIADTLLWGCCLAFFLREPIRIANGALFSTLAAVCVGFSLVLLSVKGVNHITPLLHLLPTLLLGAIVAVPAAPIGRFLETQPLQFIGRLSYSLYIWQQLFFGWLVPRLLLPVALIAIFVCAYLSYRFIEQPCIRFGRNFIGRLRVQASARLAERVP
jgi:peptidoglycan/LPS O-acetylase OafA/YrhL